MIEIDFCTAFEAVTGNPPFPWQRALYSELKSGTFRPCDLPTRPRENVGRPHLDDRVVIRDQDRSALEWLAALSERSAPAITAPAGKPTETGYRISVPNNDTDKIAEAWVAGDRAEAHSLVGKLRTMKPVRPTRLVGGGTIFYTWTLPDGTPDGHPAINSLLVLARNVVVLGWGVDQVVGRCEVIDPARHAQLAGERWTPTGRHRAANVLRVPITGTLRALEVRHQRFMDRVSDDGVNWTSPRIVGSVWRWFWLCARSYSAGATYPSAECRRTRL